ncbi:MAG: amidohydrolase [Filifactoraceae bacterium]
MEDVYEVSADIKAAIKSKLEVAIKLSNDLAANPELSGEEYQSSQKMVELLREHGFVVEYPFAGFDTAFCGVLDRGEGPSICFIAEYDALPDIGHGCGHNLHGSMSILCGLACSLLKDSFSGKVYVIGTPSEEVLGSKVTMAEQKIFDNMDLVTMMHSWSGGLSQANMNLLSLRCYHIEFIGQESHAVAGPWKGKSALAAARKFLDLIDARRECFTPDIKFNSIFTQGGKAPNIIPGYAQLKIEFRADSIAKLEMVEDMVRKCANGAALALDCSVNFTKVMDDFADMVCVPALEEEVWKLLEARGYNLCGKDMPNGSSDIGNISYRCPTIQPLISIASEAYALHTVEMAKATCEPEAYLALQHGAEVLTLLGMKVLTNPSFCNDIKQSFFSARESKFNL